ncbi:phosphatidylinositol 4-phosphate 5-kinase-like protein 1 isoform X1 [Lethenteron reissneri]|uniref:phosphatidylinositol 4-phosphate 5-kinase-like protein 1 isoform X1 n=1 Tax=Lethenteron reissneri TaxID=7753 RepID=UPI002AB686D0|nr:phosphatidylinositol 4-phosphate 5-kinase-like protein 1 isoform X1 [Lethenteron reissneri]
MENDNKTDSQAGRASVRSRTFKSRILQRFRDKWKLLGLFEIELSHEFYWLTCCLKSGLSAALQHGRASPPPVELRDADYEAVLTQTHQDFVLETFAGPVFASFRQLLGLKEDDYVGSLASPGCYLQFISNSKSKADFFLTNDKRFFLKTQNKREYRFLLRNLRKYVQHFEKYPHTLLVKILGLHRISLSNEPKKYFIVMQSVFYPDERIAVRYDIKGCELGRWTQPAPEGSPVIVVLKDNNFGASSVRLGPEHPWFLRQLELDTAFLRGLSVLDYSLLLASQDLHSDEQMQNHSFANLIIRTKRSVALRTSDNGGLTRAPIPGSVQDQDTGEIHEGGDSDDGDDGDGGSNSTNDGSIPGTNSPGANIPGANRTGADSENVVGFPYDKSVSVETFARQNRRLLPACRNALHVLDGPCTRYYVGIIDIFTVFSVRKRLEAAWKSVRHCGTTFSTVSPDHYAARLSAWARSHVE